MKARQQPHSNRPGVRVIGLALLLGIPAGLTAQVAGQPAPAAAATDQAPIVLSPFQVTASEDDSYAATQTLAGTRFNSELKDVPASISVMTADFLRDIGAANLNEALEYTIGAEVTQTDVTGQDRQTNDLQLTMRGFSGSILSRNYFQVNTSQDNYNMERATFSRGPNSVLYGSGGAGGIADTTTKRALQKNVTSLTTRIGLYDDYRFALDVNRMLTKDLAVRVNLLDWQKKTWRDFEFMDRRSGALAVTWKPLSRTTVRVDAEYGDVDELKAPGWPAFDGVMQWSNLGRPTSNTYGTIVPGTMRINNSARYYFTNNNSVRGLSGHIRSLGPTNILGAAQGVTTFEDESIFPFSLNTHGPEATTNNDFLNAGVFIEQQVTDKLFVELAANHQANNRVWHRYNWNDNRIYGDSNKYLDSANTVLNPYLGQYYLETSAQGIGIETTDMEWNDYRLTAAYDFRVPRFGTHQIAAMISRRDTYDNNTSQREAWINNPSQANYTNSVNRILRRTYVSFSADNPLNLPRGFTNTFSTPIDVDGVKSGFYYQGRNNSMSRFDSKVAVMQSKLWKNRLVTTVGVREDVLRAWGHTFVRNPTTQEVIGSTRNPNYTMSTGTTGTYGVVLHVLPQVSFAVNKSSNANPQTFQAWGEGTVARNILLGNKEGDGTDYSVRLSLFEGRVQGTVAYFETAEQNARRAKFGNSMTGWAEYLNKGLELLEGVDPGKYFTGVAASNRFDGDDTVDITAEGWETEWTVNVNRNLRFVINGSTMKNVEANKFPRLLPQAAEIRDRLLKNPTNSLGVYAAGLNQTWGDLAAQIDRQLKIDLAPVGKSINNARPDSGNIFANYRFHEGRLKGVSASMGANYRGERVIGYHTVTSEPIWANGYTSYRASLGYERNLTLGSRKYKWSITLSGENIFGDKKGLLPAAGTEFQVDRFFFEPTPNFFLTNKITF